MAVLLAAAAFLPSGTAAARYLVAAPSGAGFVLRGAPGGAVLGRVGRQTAFGTPVVLGVVARRHGWLGVTTDALPNGVVGWIDIRTARLSHTTISLRVSLHRRRLRLFDSGRVVRSFVIGVGSSSTPTPIGRFAVAEKLDGPGIGGAFGCCILGLSAHQPHPPSWWDQTSQWLVAIHGGGGLGSAVSAGCLHLAQQSLRYLMRIVPLGAPVFVAR